MSVTPTIDGFAILFISTARKTMAQKGDRFNPAAKFGPVVQFDTAPTQRTPSFSEDTYQGRILRNWDDALGSTPSTSILTGLRISGFGTPGLAPAPGIANASLIQYVKQIEIDLAAIRTDTAALRNQLAALATSVTAIATSTAAIATSTAAIATFSEAIALSAAGTATSTAAIAASSATIATQQVQIISLLTSIDSKTL